ncbi:MAG: hypothetical protein KTR20_13140 [Cellvibrionaceae bacterium]|nr:hypothetical protein [Cellvibrionaceae bacterium]
MSTKPTLAESTTSASTSTTAKAAASKPATEKHWSDVREAGTLLGIRLLLLLYRLCGRRFFSVLMYPVALYFMCFRPSARAASLEFLRTHARHFPKRWQQRPHYWHVLLHFKTFAEVILDKLLAWSIDIDGNEFIVAKPEVVDALMHDTRGQLIIGSHFGNLEYCRGFMQRYRDKVINILVYDRHSENFVNAMQRENPKARLHVYQVDEFDLATIIQLKQKTDRGEWVFIAGDRIPLTGVARTVEVEFLGKTAALPIGPYLLAKALACPVKLMFAYKDTHWADTGIFFDVVPFAEQIVLARTQRQAQLGALAQQFASALEQHCGRAPYQWFNFYPFWAQHTPTSTAVSKAKS